MQNRCLGKDSGRIHAKQSLEGQWQKNAFCATVNSTPVSLLEKNLKLEQVLFFPSINLNYFPPSFPMLLSNFSTVDVWTTFLSITWQ